MKNEEKRKSFIDQFVNAVYGILLGYGFCDATKEISKVFNYFHAALVLFAIIVICVHWWDWLSNIGKRVETNVIEFSIDIAILLNLVWLFFVYKDFGTTVFLMLTLAMLNFIWVVNYRFQDFISQYSLSFTKLIKDRELLFKMAKQFPEYIKNKEVVSHIIKRFFGVILFSFVFFVHYLLNPKQESHLWIFYALLVLAFIFDRAILYRDRSFKYSDATKKANL